jgi:hypothetical protein
MKLCAALDTPSSKTAICVVNSRDGSIMSEMTVVTDPAIIFGRIAPRFFRDSSGLVTRPAVCRLGRIGS